MSFVPMVPLGGYAGWSFLKRTLDSQQAAFAGGAQQKRDEAYFRENIGKVRTSDALLSDRRLLRVALGAFGLDADIGAKAFLRKVLDDGTLDPAALANRLADKRYLEFSKAFGFGDFDTPNTVLSDFADRIMERYRNRTFEAAVGAQRPEMRLALFAQGELATLAARPSSERTKWLTVMGTPQLRTVFEQAFGLPRSFGALGLDQQLTAFQEKAERYLGSSTISQFSDPDRIDTLIRLSLVRGEASGAFGSASANPALAGASVASSLLAAAGAYQTRLP
jgi:hypothetical protein